MNALHKLTDKILADRSAAGDTDAFGILFNRYSKKVYRFIYFRVREQETIDDIVNNVFLQLWEVCQSGVRIDNIKAYIYRAARNQVIDHYRMRKDHLGIEEAHEFADDIDVHQDMVKDDDVKNLLKNLDKLKIEYKEVLQLRYVDDMDIEEISLILEKSIGSVKVTIHRAIQKLKEIYNK